MTTNDQQWDVFISYKSSSGGKAARRLQNVLETTAARLGRPMRVFRDQTGLPLTGPLPARLKQALTTSHHLVVVLEPHTAESTWVSEEISTWLRSGGTPERLGIVRADATLELTWNADPPRLDATCPLPEPLGSCFDTEPAWADGYRGADGAGLFRMAAGILDVPVDTVLQREAMARRRRRRQLIGGAALFAILAVVAIVGLTTALVQSRRTAAVSAEAEATALLGEAQLRWHTDPIAAMKAYSRAAPNDTTGFRTAQATLASDLDWIDSLIETGPGYDSKSLRLLGTERIFALASLNHDRVDVFDGQTGNKLSSFSLPEPDPDTTFELRRHGQELQLISCTRTDIYVLDANNDVVKEHKQVWDYRRRDCNLFNYPGGIVGPQPYSVSIFPNDANDILLRNPTSNSSSASFIFNAGTLYVLMPGNPWTLNSVELPSGRLTVSPIPQIIDPFNASISNLDDEGRVWILSNQNDINPPHRWCYGSVVYGVSTTSNSPLKIRRLSHVCDEDYADFADIYIKAFYARSAAEYYYIDAACSLHDAHAGAVVFDVKVGNFSGEPCSSAALKFTNGHIVAVWDDLGAVFSAKSGEFALTETFRSGLYHYGGEQFPGPKSSPTYRTHDSFVDLGESYRNATHFASNDYLGSGDSDFEPGTDYGAFLRGGFLVVLGPSGVLGTVSPDDAWPVDSDGIEISADGSFLALTVSDGVMTMPTRPSQLTTNTRPSIEPDWYEATAECTLRIFEGGRQGFLSGDDWEWANYTSPDLMAGPVLASCPDETPRDSGSALRFNSWAGTDRSSAYLLLEKDDAFSNLVGLSVAGSRQLISLPELASSISWAPDSNRLGWVSASATAGLWTAEVSDGHLTDILRVNTSSFSGLDTWDLDPSGRFALLTFEDRAPTLLDIRSGGVVGTAIGAVVEPQVADDGITKLENDSKIWPEYMQPLRSDRDSTTWLWASYLRDPAGNESGKTVWSEITITHAGHIRTDAQNRSTLCALLKPMRC